MDYIYRDAVRACSVASLPSSVLFSLGWVVITIHPFDSQAQNETYQSSRRR